MKKQIIEKLTAAGIETTGSYANLPAIIEDVVDTVKNFGFDFWLTQTTSGKKVRNIVLELSK